MGVNGSENGGYQLKTVAGQPGAVQLDPADNVATAIRELEANTVLDVGDTTLEVRERIPFGFKVALTDIEAGQAIRKYGQKIGLARYPIARGSLVHIHNVEGERGRGDKLPHKKGG